MEKGRVFWGGKGGLWVSIPELNAALGDEGGRRAGRQARDAGGFREPHFRITDEGYAHACISDATMMRSGLVSWTWTDERRETAFLGAGLLMRSAREDGRGGEGESEMWESQGRWHRR